MNAALYGLALVADGNADIPDGLWVVMVVMMVGMLAFLGAVAVAVVWATRAFAAGRRPPPNGGDGDSALATLDRSLAEGKVSVEDYERRRRMLTGQPPGGPEGGGR